MGAFHWDRRVGKGGSGVAVARGIAPPLPTRSAGTAMCGLRGRTAWAKAGLAPYVH